MITKIQSWINWIQKIMKFGVESLNEVGLLKERIDLESSPEEENEHEDDKDSEEDNMVHSDSLVGDSSDILSGGDHADHKTDDK